MKSSIVCSLLAGAVIFAAVGAKAQVQEKLNISGTAVYQLPEITNNAGTILIDKVKTVAFNNKRILAALNASYAFTNSYGVIPSGSWLTVDATTDEIWVTNKSGYAVSLTASTDSSSNPFGKFDYSSATDVFSGQRNINTLQANYTDWSSAASLTLQDGAGTSVTLYGLTKFSTVLSKKVVLSSTSYKQTETDSRNFSGTGPATYKNSSAVAQGKVSGSGRGVVTTDTSTATDASDASVSAE